MTTTSNTSETPLSTVIGIFPTHEQADRAIDELRHTNFRYDHIRVVERGTGGFGDTLKGLFTGQAAMASNTADSLVKMGMPEYEAQYYQRELDADHVLVLMNADDRPEEAFSVMRQNGAFDINSRLRLPAIEDTRLNQAPPRQQMPPVATAPAVSPVANRGDMRYTDGAQAPYANTQPVTPAPDAPVDPNMAYDRNAQPVTPAPDAPVDPNAADQRTGWEAPRNA